ncbi:hypothetical protein NWI01_24790 [Nitrobacter winogradskyi]|uniref:Uncharacterized protein n=1 Tax=Nitrobacter winogradskyi TaxID=913 RepID=A0A4Y3WC31_NITWI|nr:hypothetical protein NWI01_24790 [Nitrobacter winogradskyi]
MQDLNRRALDDAEFEKTPFDLVRRHAKVVAADHDGADPAAKAATREAERRSLVGFKGSGTGI